VAALQKALPNCTIFPTKQKAQKKETPIVRPSF